MSFLQFATSAMKPEELRKVATAAAAILPQGMSTGQELPRVAPAEEQVPLQAQERGGEK